MAVSVDRAPAHRRPKRIVYPGNAFLILDRIGAIEPDDGQYRIDGGNGWKKGNAKPGLWTASIAPDG
jgi:hypothetical protein